MKNYETAKVCRVVHATEQEVVVAPSLFFVDAPSVVFHTTFGTSSVVDTNNPCVFLKLQICVRDASCSLLEFS